MKSLRSYKKQWEKISIIPRVATLLICAFGIYSNLSGNVEFSRPWAISLIIVFLFVAQGDIWIGRPPKEERGWIYGSVKR